MPEVIFPGPEGRLEGRFHPGTRPRAPVALVLHSHPQAGGSKNNKIVQLLYQPFASIFAESARARACSTTALVS
jgi:alpha/beta superfamily hydrolase